MARVNKMISGVFSTINGNDKKIASYDAFLNSSGLKTNSANIKRYVDLYREEMDKERKKFEYFSALERVIMQQRSMDNISQIRVYKVREYLYARCPFYRDDVATKDVRILVDNAEFWPQSIAKIEKDEKFMKKAKEKLRKLMADILQDSITKLELIQNELKRGTKKPAEKKEEPAKPAAKKAAPKKAEAKKPAPKKPAAKKPAAKKVAEAPKPKMAVIEETVEAEL